jgi:hypothetical protein
MQCTIFGDPHIRSFDSATEDYYNTGVWNLVTSPSLGVIIQGVFLPTKATNGLSVTKEIGVGGSLIGNNVLRIGVERAFWNLQPILTTFPSTFICPGGYCTIIYNSNGGVLQPGREGKEMHVIHITMKSGVKIQINRWNLPSEGRYMNVQITMPRSAAPVSGLCGNANGNAMDDHRRAVFDQIGSTGVSQAELLTGLELVPVHNEISQCPDEKLRSAHADCKAASATFWPHMSCLISVCKGGTAEAWKAGQGAVVA